jgi:hypothetical protein
MTFNSKLKVTFLIRKNFAANALTLKRVKAYQTHARTSMMREYSIECWSLINLSYSGYDGKL